MSLSKTKDLPATRLELSWHEMPRDADGYDMRCDYHLVLELGESDIRAEREDGPDVLELRVSLGGTRTTRRRCGLVDRARGEIETPFRDGAHIRWDALRLQLPAFVVCGDDAMELKC